MDELREIRIEELKKLYEQLDSTYRQEDVEALMKKIRVLEEAIAKDQETDAKIYEIDMKCTDEAINRSHTEKENRKDRIIEGIKIGCSVVGAVVSTVTTLQVATWIGELEKTGTIRSKMYDIVRKSMK